MNLRNDTKKEREKGRFLEMSKIKWSFSLLFTILLVGVLSTAAFARGAYWEKVGSDGKGGFDFGLKNTASVDQDFTINVFSKSDDYKDAIYTTTATTVKAGASATINVPASAGIKVGTIYKFILYIGSNDVGVKFGVLTDNSNLAMASMADDQNGLLDVDGSGLINSNHTGQDAVRKNHEKIHGAYQNNTNSCASCHQTHGAADGEFLLFKDGVYSTCSACHDGTTGAYNAFAPVSKENTEGIAGTFDVHGEGQNGSLHTADGSLKISAAPGGHVGATSGPYSQDFDCASCHAAHGAGSNGENNLNVDPMGWGSVPYAAKAGEKVSYYKGHGMTTVTTTDDNKNGKLFFDIPIYDSVAAAKDDKTPYILVKSKATAADAGSFWYKRAGVKEGDQVIQTYRLTENKGYIADYSLWNREQGYPFVANTVLKQGDTDITMNPALKVVWRDGFAFGSAAALVDHATISIGIDVETSDDIATLWDGTIPDSGIEMSKYCGSCHVDYLSETRTNDTGVYTTAHRHATIGRDETTCVRCHYAHGSEAQIMKDANDNTYWDLTAKGLSADQALTYLADPNPSSAIKRYTGMSVCYACHGGGQQFLGSPRTNQPDNTTDEFLKGGQPGDDRTTISK